MPLCRVVFCLSHCKFFLLLLFHINFLLNVQNFLEKCFSKISKIFRSTFSYTFYFLFTFFYDYFIILLFLCYFFIIIIFWSKQKYVFDFQHYSFIAIIRKISLPSTQTGNSFVYAFHHCSGRMSCVLLLFFFFC